MLDYRLCRIVRETHMALRFHVELAGYRDGMDDGMFAVLVYEGRPIVKSHGRERVGHDANHRWSAFHHGNLAGEAKHLGGAVTPIIGNENRIWFHTERQSLLL
ncbi:MAG: hypothetical protein PVSMB7_12040 [Chloroflexota bacterium]